MEPDKYCYKHKHYHDPSEVCEKCATERRAVYERAFWAGIANDLCMEFAHRDALVIVRQWPAMMAELEQEIAK